MGYKYFVFLIFCLTLSGTIVQIPSCESGGSFHNPILDDSNSIQYIYRHSDGFYYMTRGVGTDLYLYKSNSLSDWRLAERKIVHTNQSGHENPQIHYLRDNWFIYFYQLNETLSQNHLFVIRAENPDNPFGKYSQNIRLTPATPEEGYDEVQGTILETIDGNLYLIYVGYSTNPPTGGRKIFLAPMSNPTTIIGSRTLIRNGKADWDLDMATPNLFRSENQTFLVFTAWFSGVSLMGLMVIDDGDDPLVSANWRDVSSDPVFRGNDQVSNPRYASFTSSPDLTETWMAYSAANSANDTVYTSRIQKISWNDDGTPQFPTPTGLATSLPVPSGDV